LAAGLRRAGGCGAEPYCVRRLGVKPRSPSACSISAI
jgi:hypothetical protein